MSKLGNRGIPITLTEDNVLKIAIDQGVVENKFNWKLVREHDGMICKSRAILWLEWDEKGQYKDKHDDIAVGRALLMSPFNEMFTWQTTEVTMIVAATPNNDYIKFETRNSTYELFKLYDAPTGNPV
jgi:hypothetical protein